MSWELVQDRSQPSTMSAVLHLGANSAGGAGLGDGQEEQSSDATGVAANTLRFLLEIGFKLIVDTSHRQQFQTTVSTSPNHGLLHGFYRHLARASTGLLLKGHTPLYVHSSTGSG